MEANRKLKKSISIESFVFLIFFFGAFTLIGREMGAANMLSTMMNTSYELLINTVLYITAIAVLAGALSELLSEFGVISIANIMLSPVIRFLYGLPGASIIGMFATYFSDNPAILTLADNKAFRRYFKLYQLPALTNIGTSFGMGLIITTFFISLKSPTGETFILAVIIGNVCAVIGSIISTRIMLLFTAKIYGKEADCESDGDNHFDIMKFRVVREGSVGNRILESVLDGGKFGVKMGVSIVPGVLIICTIIMMLTNGPSDV